MAGLGASDNAEPAISFLIPVRNDAERLRRCLETIRRSAAAFPVEILVGDNGSTDSSAAVAAAAGAPVVNAPDLQVSEIRNVLARHARGEWLAFIDADHELDPRWCEAAWTSRGDRSVAAVGDQYCSPNTTWVQRAYDLLRRRATTVADVEWIPSGNMVVRKTAFDSVGGFDPSLVTCEDVDLCRRLRESGGRVLAVPGMLSVHIGDPTNLAAVFRGELWRGRDAVRLALRSPWKAESLRGILFPLVTLAGLLSFAAGIVSAIAGTPLWPLWLGIGLIAMPVAAVFLTLLIRRGNRPDSGVGLAGIGALAVVYTTARGLAPIFPGGHNLRRKG